MGSGGETRRGSNKGRMAPCYPSSIPHITAVGATTLASFSPPAGETAASSFGSGGGFDYYFNRTDYQAQEVAAYLAQAPKPALQYAAGGRGTPDVSSLGESVTITAYGNMTLNCEGTSASSPSFMGVVSLLNAACLKLSGSPLGFLNPLLYAHPEVFNDITEGTNAVGPNAGSGWAAAPGWDAATGLGSANFPKMLAMVEKVCKAAGQRRGFAP
eukprot:TRINITY_DN9618_c0_g3_i2.p1 TRINITY_DN9618_c0_g3~~TRINITY_DN9618_c0_g3_i2.p1  ORF type:complete len:214 (+),score=72.11 TRINITY_DN9618_c0_g3_i2:509-1150(+)